MGGIGRVKDMKLTILVCLAVLVCGCEQLMQPISTEPNAPALIEPVIDSGVALGQGLGVLWPPLGMIATAVAGIFAGYKKLKPQLEQAKGTSEKYHAAGATLASVLEDVKKNQPEVWKVIGPKIADATRATSDVEAAIKGFRGV